MFQALEHVMPPRLRVEQPAFHFGSIEFLAIDGSILAGLRHSFGPTARAKQTVKVDAWHAAQRQHDRVGRDKPVDLQPRRLNAVRIRQRIEIVDVQLVGPRRAIRMAFVGYASSVRHHAINQRRDLVIPQNAACWIQADSIM